MQVFKAIALLYLRPLSLSVHPKLSLLKDERPLMTTRKRRGYEWCQHMQWNKEQKLWFFITGWKAPSDYLAVHRSWKICPRCLKRWPLCANEFELS